jgi:hypothetical protein
LEDDRLPVGGHYTEVAAHVGKGVRMDVGGFSRSRLANTVFVW